MHSRSLASGLLIKSPRPTFCEPSRRSGLEKPETARRLRQRIGTVFDWAKAAGHRTGDNPIEGVSKGLPNQGDRDEHFTALPYKDVPQFVTRLREGQANPATKLAFEFLILTAFAHKRSAERPMVRESTTLTACGSSRLNA